MHISVKVVHLVLSLLISVSCIHSQPHRPIIRPNRGNGFPMDDIVAAIATAAINGQIPFNKLNLGNPNRKGEALRIPILLIRQNDLRNGLKNGKLRFSTANDRPVWGHKNGKGLQSGDYLKKDYSPKPKFPTHGLKLIPAPKLEFEKSALKKGISFEKKPIRPVQINDREPENWEDRDVDNNENNRFYNRINDERVNRDRLNNYNPNTDRFNDNSNRFNDRFNRPSDRWPDNRGPKIQELPEKEPLNDDYDGKDYDDNRPLDQPLPPLKPAMKVPSIVRHVYGANALMDSSKPTIPPRYLKGMSDIASISSASAEKYDNVINNDNYNNNNNNNNNNDNYNNNNNFNANNNFKDIITNNNYNTNNNNNKESVIPFKFEPEGNSSPGPLTKIPPMSQFFPPIKDGQSVTYKSEPVVSYKSINLGDVYQKANGEQEEQDVGDDLDGPLAGYAKDPYDKQLINTLKNLMATSKDRHPINIGGLTGGDSTSKSTGKSVAKSSASSLFTKKSSSPLSFTTYKSSAPSGSTQNQQLIPQTSSSSQTYSSQTAGLSRIPDTVFSPLSYSSVRTAPASQGLGAAQSVVSDKYLSVGDAYQPSAPEVSRKPVSLDLSYKTGGAAQPLSALSYANMDDDVSDEYGPTQTFGGTEGAVFGGKQLPQQSQAMKTYVVAGNYQHKSSSAQPSPQDRDADDQYDDKDTENSEISETYAQLNDAVNYRGLKLNAPLASLKQPIYVQLGQSVFLAVDPKGSRNEHQSLTSKPSSHRHLVNTVSRNHRPSQKVSKNLLLKTQQKSVNGGTGSGDDIEIIDDYVDDSHYHKSVSNGHNVTKSRLTTDGKVFSCENRTQGYYVDVRHNCQIYYQCYLGGSYKFSCPNGTQFDEQRLLCDWAEHVVCGDGTDTNGQPIDTFDGNSGGKRESDVNHSESSNTKNSDNYEGSSDEKRE